jgi:hypothetical protein
MQTPKTGKLFRAPAEFFSESYAALVDSRPVWLSIIQTRILLTAVLTVVAASFTKVVTNQILIWISIYIFFNLVLVFKKERTLRLKKWRLSADFADVVLISGIIYLSGNLDSSLLLFYFFPIISAARYFGRNGSILVAVSAGAGYATAFLILDPDPRTSAASVLLRSMCFLGAAFVAGNLTRYRQLAEIKHTEVLEELNKTLIKENDIKDIYDLI